MRKLMTILGPILLILGTGLRAEQKPQAFLDVVVIQVPGVTDSRPMVITSGEAVRLLRALLRDTATQLVDRSQLRVINGMTSTIQIKEPIPLVMDQLPAEIACASPLLLTLRNSLGTGVNVEITPRLHSAEELILHVVVSDLGCLGKNMFDLKLRDREITLLRSGTLRSKSNPGSQLVVALIPEIVQTRDGLIPRRSLLNVVDQ
jgi:hypothetical protein